jgi:hypothetical protein
MANVLNAPYPQGLEPGEAHDSFAADRGDGVLFYFDHDGVRRR